MTQPEAHANAPNGEGQTDAARLGQEMRRLHRLISSHVLTNMQGDLQDHDLTFPQVTALHHLRARSPLTVTALAERISLSVPATSHLVERLVRRGLAARRENPDNRREKLIALTAQGLRIVTRMDEGFTGAYIAVFGTAPPATIRAATASIQALLAELAPDPCPTPPQETP